MAANRLVGCWVKIETTGEVLMVIDANGDKVCLHRGNTSTIWWVDLSEILSLRVVKPVKSWVDEGSVAEVTTR